MGSLEKGIFPFDACTTEDFLDRTSLPADAADWVNELNPAESPSQEEVDAALALYESRGFRTVRDYMADYLGLDCKILQKAILQMKSSFSAFLELDFVDSAKYTVSSLAAEGSQFYLAKERRAGMFFVNHSRLYSLLKGGLRGGLNMVFRTIAGTKADYTSHMEVFKKHLESLQTQELEQAYEWNGLMAPPEAVEIRKFHRNKQLESLPGLTPEKLLTESEMRRVLAADVDPLDVEFVIDESREELINKRLFQNPCTRCGYRRKGRWRRDIPYPKW